MLVNFTQVENAGNLLNMKHVKDKSFLTHYQSGFINVQFRPCWMMPVAPSTEILIFKKNKTT
jgi:hypothetical protein